MRRETSRRALFIICHGYTKVWDFNLAGRIELVFFFFFAHAEVKLRVKVISFLRTVLCNYDDIQLSHARAEVILKNMLKINSRFYS